MEKLSELNGPTVEIINPIERARTAIEQADAMLITAGAGMGVDSGLPDFRGDEGFWRAYPVLARLGLSFDRIARSSWFKEDPALAWGFYGHRLNLYRRTVPHPGFKRLLGASERMEQGCYVVTSNVDGQFQRAGFDASRITEMHGSIHTLQCSVPCHRGLWSADGLQVEVDPGECRAVSKLPCCPECGAVARPNILMFDDRAWLNGRSNQQHTAFSNWLQSVSGKHLVIVECGAGTAIPTIRWISSSAGRNPMTTLIRINPREFEITGDGISIPMGAMSGISGIFQNAD